MAEYLMEVHLKLEIQTSKKSLIFESNAPTVEEAVQEMQAFRERNGY